MHGLQELQYMQWIGEVVRHPLLPHLSDLRRARIPLVITTGISRVPAFSCSTRRTSSPEMSGRLRFRRIRSGQAAEAA